MKINVAVIGTGIMGKNHARVYSTLSNVELVAICDVGEESKKISDQFNTKYYKDYKEMLKKENLDVVSICTPNAFHAENTIAALKAGCHVLCEKPIATTLKEADRMMEAAKKARRKLMIGFTHRLLSGPKKCKQLLEQKAIGKPFMIRVRFAHGGPYPGWAKNAWFYNKKLAAGGAMLDMGIHAIDLSQWLFGPIVSVNGLARTLVKKIEVDANAILNMEFKNGALGYIEVGWTSQPGFSGFEIYGTEGTLICDYVRGLQLCTGNASAGQDGSVKWKMIDKNPTRGGWDGEIKYWLDVIDGKEKLTMSGKAGRDALAVALSAYKSSETGRRIDLR